MDLKTKTNSELKLLKFIYTPWIRVVLGIPSIYLAAIIIDACLSRGPNWFTVPTLFIFGFGLIIFVIVSIIESYIESGYKRELEAIKRELYERNRKIHNRRA